MINKKFMNKAMVMAIVGITISTPMLNTVSAMEIENIDSEVEYEVSLNNHEENKKIIIEQGEGLTVDDFCEVYEVYEENASKGIILTDEQVLELLVKKLEYSQSEFAYEIFGRKVTKEELKLVATYPTDATKVMTNSKTASSEASNRYIQSTLYLGNGDAFRHGYWNALNAKSVGVTRAKQFADAHESETPNSNDKTMDLKNNEIGRSLGKDGASNTILRDRVLSQVSQGKLWRLQGAKPTGALIKTDGSGRK